MADTDGYESTGKPWTRDQWELKVIEMLQEEPDVTADERKATRPISPNCSTSRSLKSERLRRPRCISRKAISRRASIQDGLPLGTVGGIGVQHYFPLDGEYQFQVSLIRTNTESVRGLEHQHQLEITIDGERVFLAALVVRRRRVRKGTSPSARRRRTRACVCACR